MEIGIALVEFRSTFCRIYRVLVFIDLSSILNRTQRFFFFLKDSLKLVYVRFLLGEIV